MHREPRPEMPRHTHDNDVLASVARDRGLSLARLAEATDIDASFLSRVFSGQYAAPPALLRTMFALTGDERVVRVALGDDAVASLNGGGPDQRAAIRAEASQSLRRLGERIGGDHIDAQAIRHEIQAAARLLRSLDSHLQTVDLVA